MEVRSGGEEWRGKWRGWKGGECGEDGKEGRVERMERRGVRRMRMRQSHDLLLNSHIFSCT